MKNYRGPDASQLEAKKHLTLTTGIPEQMTLESRISYINELRTQLREMLSTIIDLPVYKDALLALQKELTAWYVLWGMNLSNERWAKIFKWNTNSRRYEK
jgi:hypothetical protein